MQQLQLDAVDPRPKRCDIPHRCQHILCCFPRQSQDQMHDDGDAGGFQLPDCFRKHPQGIASPEIVGGALMDRLQPELHPDRLDPVQIREHLHDLSVQAVRPGGDGQDHDLRPPDDFRIELPQSARVPVGICERLKIGDIFPVLRRHRLRKFGIDPFFRLPDLVFHRRKSCSEITGAAFGAEAAAVCPDRSVPVRAGAAGAQGKLQHFPAVRCL